MSDATQSEEIQELIRSIAEERRAAKAEAALADVARYK